MVFLQFIAPFSFHNYLQRYAHKFILFSFTLKKRKRLQKKNYEIKTICINVEVLSLFLPIGIIEIVNIL